MRGLGRKGRWFKSIFKKVSHTLIILGIVAILSNNMPVLSFSAVPVAGEASGPSTSDGVRSSDPAIKIESDAELIIMASSEGWPGNGTEGNPYIIENYDINGSTYHNCIRITHVALYLIIRNNTLHHIIDELPYFTNSALRLEDVDNVVVEGNTILDCQSYGISIMYSTATVQNNTILDCHAGIRIAGTEGKVLKNTVRNFTRFYGIMVSSCPGLLIQGNVLEGTPSGSRSGIEIMTARACTIRFNELVRCGIWTRQISDSSIDANKINGNLYVQDSDSVDIVDNDLVRPGPSSVTLNKCDSILLRRNELEDGQVHLKGEALIHFNSHDIDGTNTINGNPIGYYVKINDSLPQRAHSQLILVECQDLRLTKAHIAGEFFGLVCAYCYHLEFNGIREEVRWKNDIWLYSSMYIEILDCAMGDIDITLDHSNYTMLRDNELTNMTVTDLQGIRNAYIGNNLSSQDGIGIHLYATVRARVIDNIISVTNESAYASSTNYGLSMEDCLFGAVMNNTFSGGGVKVHAAMDSAGWFNVNWDDLNTVNGLPIHYVRNASEYTPPGTFGQLLLVKCSYTTIHGLDLGGTGVIITIVESVRVTVQRNRFNGSMEYSLFIFDSDLVTVSHNIFRGSGASVFTQWCRVCDIKNNYFIGSTKTPLVAYDGYKLNITENFFNGRHQKGGNAMSLMDGRECQVTYNHFKDNRYWAIKVTEGSSNTVHHNYFEDNNVSDDTSQVLSPQCYTRAGTNSWDDGMYGNYWSEYRSRYPFAESNGRVWDTPYQISQLDKDNHPLVDFKDVVPPISHAKLDIVDEEAGKVSLRTIWAIDNIGVENISWTFTYDGEETVLQDANATFDFLIPGDYTVHHRIEDGAGNQHEIGLTLTLDDLEPPVAKANEDLFIEAGTVVTFNSTNSTDNKAIRSFVWTFTYGGSPVVRRGVVATFRFDLPGVYLVVLTVTDYEGHTDTDTLTVTVVDTEPPVAHAGDDTEIVEGDVVTLSALGSTDNVGIYHYTWTLEEVGSPVELIGEELTRAFPHPGVYIVTLNVTDSSGNWDTDTMTITVRDTTPPEADAGPDVEVVAGEVLKFNGTGSWDNGVIVNWTWSFAYQDGPVLLYGPSPTFLFDAVGVYTVEMRVTDRDGNHATDTVMVMVIDLIPPVAEAGVDRRVGQGVRVEFDGSGSWDNDKVVEWKWQFFYNGRTVTLGGMYVNFTFQVLGDYKVYLICADPTRNSNTTSFNVAVVDIEAPEAMAPDHIRVLEGEIADLSDVRSTDNVGIVNWSWRFSYEGRAIEIYGRQTSFKFDRPGEYSVELTVKDAEGNDDTVTFPLIVAERPESEGTLGPWVAALLIMVPIVVLVVLALVTRRRRTP